MTGIPFRLLAASFGMAGLVTAVLSATTALAVDRFDELASWAPPPVSQVRAEVEGWLTDQPIDQGAREKIAALWPQDEVDAAPDVLLERLAETFSYVHPEARRLVELVSQPNRQSADEIVAWLTDEQRPPLVADNLRLLYGSWLCRVRLYDECLVALDELTVDEVVDPAALLFYRAVAHHRLVQPDACREDTIRLLQRRSEIPKRFEQLAELMQADLQDLKEDNLDHIARRMDDIERRLDLGRAGRKVRGIEDGVVKSLEKLIEEEEKKQQQQQQANSGGGQPNSPMQDSRIAGGSGEGKVTQKDVGDHAGWGDLSPKQREEAMQQIGREFPSHYREVAEQYMKRLATEGTGRQE